MSRRHPFDPQRRLFLQGTGSVIALPFLASLWPRQVRAATAAMPVRYLSYFVPLGMVEDAWLPSGVGAGYVLSPTLAPLQDHRASFTVISGTRNEPRGRAGGAAFGGGHGQGGGSANTGMPTAGVGQSKKTGISADQLVANAVGSQTRIPSLQLGMPGEEGIADLGLAKEYTSSMSWADATTNLAPTRSPEVIFRRLFPNGQVTGTGSTATATPANDAATAELNARKKSILDAAVAQTQSLQKNMGSADKIKLDQFLTGIRQVERSLQATSAVCAPPTGIVHSDDMDATLDQWDKLITTAFQCDQTRVISFMLGAAESFRYYTHLGISEEHHEISHYGKASSKMNTSQKLAALKKIQVYEMTRLAALLNSLKGVTEGEAGQTLLDNTVLVMFSEMSETDGHGYKNMPVLLAGGGGGRILSNGQHLAAKGDPEFAQVLLASVRAAGVEVASLGSSNESQSFPGVLGQ